MTTSTARRLHVVLSFVLFTAALLLAAAFILPAAAHAGGGKQRVWKLSASEPFNDVRDMAFDERDNSVIVAHHPGGARLRRILPTGIVVPVAGTGTKCPFDRRYEPGVCGDGGLATEAGLGKVTKIALMPTGDIFFLEHVVNDVYALRKISAKDQRLSTLLTGRSDVPIVKFGAQETTRINPINLIAVGGDLLVSSLGGRIVWRVSTEDETVSVTRVAGGDVPNPIADEPRFGWQVELPFDNFHLFPMRGGFGLLGRNGVVFQAKRLEHGAYVIQRLADARNLRLDRAYERATEDADGDIYLGVELVGETDGTGGFQLVHFKRPEKTFSPMCPSWRFRISSRNSRLCGEDDEECGGVLTIPRNPSGTPLRESNFLGYDQESGGRTVTAPIPGGGFLVADPDLSYIRFVGRDSDDRLMALIDEAVKVAKRRPAAAAGLAAFLLGRFTSPPGSSSFRFEEDVRGRNVHQQLLDILKAKADSEQRDEGSADGDSRPGEQVGSAENPLTAFTALPGDVFIRIYAYLEGAESDRPVNQLLARSAYDLLQARRLRQASGKLSRNK